MAVRTSQFGRGIDKNKKSLSATFKKAKAVSSVTRKTDKFDKPSLGDKVILGLLRAKKKLTGGKKPLTTERTSQITSRLKQAGLTQKEINKMRGKKK